MSTRAASAANSRRAKQEIVRLLFGAKYSRKGPLAHQKLDPFQYSYSDLRAAYLERLHSIHPDKSAHKNVTDSSMEKDDLHREFVELQDAWDQYEAVVRMLKNVTGGDKEEANFTMFGVGCSFSDSPEEQQRRAEITDQACRGWFSSGQLDVASVSSQTDSKQSDSSTSLLDDDWFISEEEREDSSEDVSKSTRQESSPDRTIPRRSLVDNQFRRPSYK